MPLFQNIGFKGGINANLWITLWFTRNLTWRKKKPWIWLILGGFLGKIIFFLENCCQAFQENPSLQALPTQNLIHQVSSIKVFPPNKLAGHIKKHLKLLYFEWSPPWHVGWRLSGEGCHWEYDGKNGEFENIDFRFPWLSDTSKMGFGHDVPFLNYSDRLPHPSDLCQPDRVRWG